MHFCNKCGNMYYIKLMETSKKQLAYYCRKCGNEDTSFTESSVVVSKTNVKQTSKTFDHMINPYTKLDPTLPRSNVIDCPNDACISNREDGGVEKEVIYIRYDNDNMKYVYLCSHCDRVWQFSKTA